MIMVILEHALSCVGQLMRKRAPDCKEVMETTGQSTTHGSVQKQSLNTNFYTFGPSLYQMQVSRKNVILSTSFVRFLNVKKPWEANIHEWSGSVMEITTHLSSIRGLLLAGARTKVS
jgi:hypothetical protein